MGPLQTYEMAREAGAKCFFAQIRIVDGRVVVEPKPQSDPNPPANRLRP